MKKAILLTPIVILLGLIGALSPVAAQQEVSAELFLPSGDWTVGDPLPFTLTVFHPAGSHVIMPELGEQWGEFVLAGQLPLATQTNPDGSKTTTTQLDARLFAPGEFQTPALSLSVADESGHLTDVVAEPLSVIISSVLVEGDETLRDIKPQADLPVSNLWLLGFTAALLAGVGALTMYAVHRRQRRLARLAVDNRLPHEVALDELQRIASRRLPLAGEFKEHYNLVADTVRLYLQTAFHVPTLERTTAEIRADLQQAVMGAESARRFVEILTECDLVKFADFVPGVDAADEIVNHTRAAINLYRTAVATLVVPSVAGSSLNGQLSSAEVSA